MFARKIQYITKKRQGLRTRREWEVVAFRALDRLSGGFAAMKKTKKLEGEGDSKPDEHDRYRNCSQGVQYVEVHHSHNARDERVRGRELVVQR